MDLRIQKDCSNIDWNEVSQIMKEVNIGSFPAECQKLLKTVRPLSSSLKEN